MMARAAASRAMDAALGGARRSIVTITEIDNALRHLRPHGLGADTWHPACPDRAGASHAERLSRKNQRQVPRRVIDRAVVLDAGAA